jgi:hypothetical protein
MLTQFARLKSSGPTESFGSSLIDGPALARHYQWVFVRESRVRRLERRRPMAFDQVSLFLYARRYSDQRCVNAPALAAIIERGGKE